ncbi:MAG: tripartite tricarboxylate transporter substrate binding protein [Acetobacterales bacterium]
MRRRHFITALAAATAFVGSSLIVPVSGQAQEAWPTKPITVIVPFNTGGYNDRLARAMTGMLQEALGQPVVVVNRPGANSLLGHSYFLQQPDDGYTLMVTSAMPFIGNNILLNDAKFKVEDFAFVNMPSRDFTFAATAVDKPYKTLGDFIKAVKENPGKLSIGVQPSSADFVNYYLLFEALGLPQDSVRVVTYNGGGPLRSAMAGGHFDVGFIGAEGAIPQKGLVRALTIFQAEQNPIWPEAPLYKPTVTELGGKPGSFVAGSVRGWATHATFRQKHPDRWKKLHDALKSISDNPKHAEALTNQGLSPEWIGPEASTQIIAESFELLKKHVALLKKE